MKKSNSTPIFKENLSKESIDLINSKTGKKSNNIFENVILSIKFLKRDNPFVRPRRD